ncbi:MAG: YifB family Mg chelatase-like AAA ATPase [Clostridiales bacterium]
MFAKVKTCCLIGIEGFLIDIEIDISNGIPAFEIVGLGDITVKESKERVKAAIKNSNLEFPIKKITINLSPANIRKIGALFDLGISCAILLVCGIIKRDISKWIIIGELSLDGKVKDINGILPIVACCKELGYKNIIVPFDNLYEAKIVKGVNIIAVKTLNETVNFFNGECEDIKINGENINKNIFYQNSYYDVDMSDVKGQNVAKRVLEISAAGNHSILMIGSPGSGKTMLSKRLPTILPDMTYEEVIEVTKIYSIMGLTSKDIPIVKNRPFRDPHHTISCTSLVGGGTYPKPGELSLATKGVLFLDEFPEFKKETLEALRQPLEEGIVNINRLAGNVKYPADVLLVCAANPCKCGYYIDEKRECICSAYQIGNYLNKISGALSDRIDLKIEIPQVNYEDIYSDVKEENSLSIKKRVNKARQIQLKRFENIKIKTNSQLSHKLLNVYCSLDKNCKNIMRMVFEKYSLSARAHDKIIKIARTIADLEESEEINEKHIAESIQYRCNNV